MNDLVLAGRYLFLSGVRSPEYEPAVQLFLRQHGRGGWRSIAGAFPNAAKRLELDEFPEPVRKELAALGMPQSHADRASNAQFASGRSGWQGMAVLTGCILVFLFTVAAVIAGAPIVFRAILSLLR
jgi:hypothetical protein